MSRLCAIVVCALALSATVRANRSADKTIQLRIPQFAAEKVDPDISRGYRMRYPVAVEQVGDQRPDAHSILFRKKKIGGEDSTHHAVSVPVASWVQQATAAALQRYSIPAICLPSDTLSRSRYTLQVTVTGLQVSSYTTDLTARIELSALLQDSAGKVWHRPIAGNLKVTGTTPSNPEVISRTVNQALKLALDTLSWRVAQTVDKQYNLDPVVVPPLFGGRFAPTLIDSICKLDKELYVIRGSRPAEGIFRTLKPFSAKFRENYTNPSSQCRHADEDLFVVFQIEPDGSVSFAEVVPNSLKCALLEQATVKTMQRRKFKPQPAATATVAVYKINIKELSRSHPESSSGSNGGRIVLGVLLVALNVVWWAFIFPSF